MPLNKKLKFKEKLLIFINIQMYGRELPPKLYIFTFLFYIFNFKGIRSILFLKNGLKRKKIAEKTIKIISEVIPDVAPCFPNIFDAMALENINLYKQGDRHCGLMKPS
jgi:hypothetical protein